MNKSSSENSGKVKKYYNIMKQNSYRLLRLVNNLIDITKIDAGYFNLRLKNENITIMNSAQISSMNQFTALVITNIGHLFTEIIER